jgi:cytochrome c biogenesis protein CcmG/thiol:disulfide interchange protein DsbE
VSAPATAGRARPPAGQTRKGLRLAGAAVTGIAITVVAMQFFAAAREGLIRTRGAACQALRPDPLPAALQSTEAPDFALEDVTGKTISLRSLRGHPVFLNFWATWCPPCTEEMPSMESLAVGLDGTDVRTVAVSVDEDWDVVKRFFARGTRLGVLLDRSREVPKRFGTDKFPETYLIDARGYVRHYFINKRDWSRPEAIACLESLR